MAASIVHFGDDKCLRLEVLTKSGFLVRNAGVSLSKLKQEVSDRSTDGVVVTEDEACHVAEKVVSSVRAVTSAPLILFDGLAREYDRTRFDLVIVQGIHPHQWLSQVASLIERSRVIQQESAALRERSAALRAGSSALTQDTERVLEALKGLRGPVLLPPIDSQAQSRTTLEEAWCPKCGLFIGASPDPKLLRMVRANHRCPK